MPQPKRTTSSSPSRRTAAKQPAAAKKPATAAAKKPTAAAAKKPTATARKPAAAATKPAATRKPAARKAAPPKPATSTATAAADRAVEAASTAENNLTQGLATLRDAIARLAPGNVAVVSRERVQEALDEAVRRGRVTRDDAEDLLGEILSRGRKQTEGVLGEIEALLERGRQQLEEARKRADSAAGKVRRSGAADRVVRAADRARRTVGVGPSFPILGYDDLTAGQVADRLGELSPAELRKVRDHERRHANRKSVLEAIEKSLA
jgi:polyhydroxyalkanoate synthesis regulator phasin